MANSRNVFHRSFNGNEEVRRLAVANGQLYAGVGRRVPSNLRVYRLEHSGCRLWNDETPSWLPAPGTSDLAMVEFQGDLFIGNSRGEIRRLAFNTWPKPLPHLVKGSVTSMAVFGGSLYAAAENGIHRTTNGVNWTDLGAIRNLGPNEFLDGAWTLEVFAGHLYAGVGFQTYDKDVPWKLTKIGIEVWRSADGTGWTLFKRVESDLFASVPQHVYAMKAFQGNLYLGEYEGDHGVFRTDGTAGSWEWKAVMSSGSMLALEEHNGKLYAGYYSASGASGATLLYATADGKSWAPAAGSPRGSAKSKGVASLASFGTSLYLGTADDGNGGEVLEFGSDFLLCMIADADRYSRALWSVFDLLIRDLSDAKPVSSAASSARRNVDGLAETLSHPCLADMLDGREGQLIAYLRPAAYELAEISRLAAEANTEDGETKRLAVELALRHAYRAKAVYALFLETFADIPMATSAH